MCDGVRCDDLERGRAGATVLDWLLKPEEALMIQAASPLILKLSLFFVTAGTPFGHVIWSDVDTL